MHRFLEIVNFYRRFISYAAKAQALLHPLLKGAKKKNRRPINWDQETIKAFEEVKDQLIQTMLFAHPIKDTPLTLTCNSSHTAMGATLEQKVNDN